jgi:2-polyprenyl-3-methyl-5-hydroxy-6-metoxy-1,4-benzoquinol methylase
MNINNNSDIDFFNSTYLELFPDIKSAIQQGSFSNGADHYIKFGKGENRVSPQQIPKIDKILIGVNRLGLGLEIGPSHNPVAPKKSGFNIQIVDVDSQDGLKKKYEGHGVNLDNIEPVDFIWDGRPLAELIGRAECYDYIIASHVIEHVPDLVAFLQECEKLLSSNGVLTLVIPDKRYCFDYFLPLSTTGGVLDAWLSKRTKPSPGQIFDYFANTAKRGEAIAWSDDGLGGATKLTHEFVEAKTYFNRSNSSNEYIDVHCWRFVLETFCLIVSDLNDLGLVGLNVKSTFETEGCEFYITLSKDHLNKSVERIKALKYYE